MLVPGLAGVTESIESLLRPSTVYDEERDGDSVFVMLSHLPVEILMHSAVTKGRASCTEDAFRLDERVRDERVEWSLFFAWDKYSPWVVQRYCCCGRNGLWTRMSKFYKQFKSIFPSIRA